MKKLLAVSCFSFILFSSFAQSWGPGTYAQEAMLNTIRSACYVEQHSSSVGFSESNNFFGAFLTVGGSVSINLNLDAYTEYVFVGGGENSATDVDIVATSPYGTEYRDTKADNVPVVRFTTGSAGRYSIKLKLYGGTTNSFCCLAVLKAGGYTISEYQMQSVAESLVSYGGTVSNLNSGARFLDQANQWCLYGGLLGQGSDMSINTINMGYGNRTIIGKADYKSSDIDLYVYRNGYTIKSDTESDARPQTSFYADGSGYEVKIRNAASTGRSFVMYCILDKS